MNTQVLEIIFVWNKEDENEVREIVEYSSLLLSRDTLKQFS